MQPASQQVADHPQSQQQAYMDGKAMQTRHHKVKKEAEDWEHEHMS